MHKKITSTVILCWLFCMQASAFRLIATPVVYPFLEDTVLKQSSANAAASPIASGQSFFGRLKHTITGLFQRKAPLPETGLDTKSKVALIALAMVVIGIDITVLGGPGVAAWLIPAGLLTSIVALFIKRDKSGKEVTAGGKKKRKTNIALIVAGILGAGLIALIIALSSWRMH
jgi:hypothetical protein